MHASLVPQSAEHDSYKAPVKRRVHNDWPTRYEGWAGCSLDLQEGGLVGYLMVFWQSIDDAGVVCTKGEGFTIFLVFLLDL